MMASNRFVFWDRILWERSQQSQAPQSVDPVIGWPICKCHHFLWRVIEASESGDYSLLESAPVIFPCLESTLWCEHMSNEKKVQKLASRYFKSVDPRCISRSCPGNADLPTKQLAKSRHTGDGGGGKPPPYDADSQPPAYRSPARDTCGDDSTPERDAGNGQGASNGGSNGGGGSSGDGAGDGGDGNRRQSRPVVGDGSNDEEEEKKQEDKKEEDSELTDMCDNLKSMNPRKRSRDDDDEAYAEYQRSRSIEEAHLDTVANLNHVYGALYKRRNR